MTEWTCYTTTKNERARFHLKRIREMLDAAPGDLDKTSFLPVKRNFKLIEASGSQRIENQ